MKAKKPIRKKPKNVSIFAARLKITRTNINYTQTQLAEKLNYGASAISNYERGINEPSLEDLILIAKSLNTSLDYLLGATDSWMPYFEEDKMYQILCKFSKLNQTNQYIVTLYTKYLFDKQQK